MSLKNSSLFPIAAAVIIIIIAIVITATVQSQHQPMTFSQVITVGPVWTTNAWSCTSNADYMVSGVLRGLGNSQITIAITGLGSQSLYSLDPEKMQTFQVGSPADHTMTITRTGTVTGWITLQTMSGAKANCTQT
jgi:hypothetical protein